MKEAYSFAYSLPYLAALLILILLYFIEQQKIKPISTIAAQRIGFFILLSFIGLRGHVYTDWYSYYPFFAGIPTIWNFNFLLVFHDNNFEPGFILYSAIIKSFFPSYHAWIFINALIDLICLSIVFRRYSSSYLLSYIIFFAINGLLIEFNLYRNSKALILFLYSIHFLSERKLIPYLLLNLLGASFHYSSLIFIPMYFILDKKINKYILWILFIISNIVFIFNINLIPVILNFFNSYIPIELIQLKTDIYIENSVRYKFSIGFIERILSYIIFVLSYDKLIEKKEINIVFINVFICCYTILMFSAEISKFALRFSYLFVFSYWILYPNLLSYIKSSINKNILRYLILIYCVVRTIKSNSNIYSHYDNLVGGISSYEERLTDYYLFFDTILGR